MTLPSLENARIAVIGLGYVGLPLAAHFAKTYPVVGFDIDQERVASLKEGIDHTREVSAAELAAARGLTVTADPAALEACNIFIVTVPTPIDTARRPDLTALERASETVGRAIRPGGVAIFESTVYPGATEEVCVPLIAAHSGLVYNQGFFAGYSPERINPGDGAHRLPDIKKVTAGSTPEAAALVDALYASVITAGTHRASSIRVAEAAKVIENIQRDLNIALVNELAMLFKRMGLDTSEVLEAAGTKWNFHRYTPGLVGGHCIGVDPYYLTHKAQTLGFHPEVILAGRRINDGMAAFVGNDIVKAMLARKIGIGTARMLVLGFTFKENCPDTRNTKVKDLVDHLTPFMGSIVIHDPHADPKEAMHEYGVTIERHWPDGAFDVIVLAVKHQEFLEAGAQRMRACLSPGSGMIYDLKAALPYGKADVRL